MSEFENDLLSAFYIYWITPPFWIDKKDNLTLSTHESNGNISFLTWVFRIDSSLYLI